MMLTVHGLPNKTKLQDVKALIKQECNIPDFILDNLVEDGSDAKKVRIGLTNENDGYKLMKCLEGFRMSATHVLKIVPIGKGPQPSTNFESRPNYSNQRNDYQDYPSQHDYNHERANNPSHVSHSSRNINPDTRQGPISEPRGLSDARQSLSQSMSDSLLRERYQASGDQERSLGLRTNTDFQDPTRGPLGPPTLRPASMDARVHGMQDSRTPQPLDVLMIRGQDGSQSYQGAVEHGQASNPDPVYQSQWVSGGGDQWLGSNQPVQNQNLGYNYLQPVQGNAGYGQQLTPQGGLTQAVYSQNRDPVPTQGYKQPIARPERLSTRTHVLRTVQLVDSPLQPLADSAFQSAQKPALKDNYQGSQYNAVQPPQSLEYQGQGSQWTQQGQQTKQLAYDKSYDDRRLALDKRSDPKPRTQDYDKRPFSPTRNTRPDSLGSTHPTPVTAEVRDRSPAQTIANTTTRPGQYPERRISPTRSFPEKRASPNRRSPNRRITTVATEFPLGRRASPSKITPVDRRVERKDSPVRRVSPLGQRPQNTRRISPFARKDSPGSRVSPHRKVSPGRRVSPGKRASPGRRVSPPGRRTSPSGRRSSPGRRVSPPGRRGSPPGRRGSPPGRRISPPGRKTSPGRKVSPFGRKVSPVRRASPGKRISPKRNEPRRMSPSMMKHDYYVEEERRMGGRLESPRRFSPKRSPPRGSGRYSPNAAKYDSGMADTNAAKPIRPAYEPTQAQKYTGGAFRSNETQFPAGVQPKTVSPWQNEKITYPIKDSRDGPRTGRAEPLEKNPSHSRDGPRTGRAEPLEKNPSPRSRSRSPVQGRFRRRSPSPRSPRSPRRSWALEKRRSPEVGPREPPPPPLWPGQDSEGKPRHPVWEGRLDNSDDERRFDEKRARTDDKYKPRFSPRRDIEDRRDYRTESKFERDYRPEDRADYRRVSPRRDEKKLFTEVDKDFNDIYQRAVEFRRKTEELRKSIDRRNRSYEEDESPVREIVPHVERPDKTKPIWIPIKLQTKELKRDTRYRLDSANRAKRDKAAEDIAYRTLEPHHFKGEQGQRVFDELKFSVFNLMMEMFKDEDVSYIELVIKFRARYDAKDMEKILLDLLTSMPSHYKNSLKRRREGSDSVPVKVAKTSPPVAKEEPKRAKLSDSVIPDWGLPIQPPKVLSMPLPQPILTAPAIVQPPMYPVPVPSYQLAQPMYQDSLHSTMQVMQSNMHANLQANLQSQLHSNLHKQMQTNIQMQSMQQNLHSQLQSNYIEPKKRELDEGYDLYLCQDDFETFSENQAEKLKTFLVTQMFKASETGNGWAPDFSLKGLHSMHRYELSTHDEASKNWIINLDFSEFEFFNVLVYTKEELWYERAAIWLPGHSRYRNIEPLEKLRLQNKNVEGIRVGKWKFVKKIVTAKGTRLYVDMPPSSARALEKQKMMLSYELGKVNVYLKAVAVDKEVFDAGLKAHSITDPSEILNAMQATMMPTLSNQQLGIVKVTLNGAKTITIQQAAKIKEMVVYNLFKYHQQEGKSKTDFLKYGFCPPNCLGIVPENNESKRWLMGRSFGKLNRQVIIVLGGDDATTKYFRMRAVVPFVNLPNATHNTQVTMERLKSSNQGIKGLNFKYWKPISISMQRGKTIFDVDVDLESTETLIKIHFKLDYINESGTHTVTLRSDYSLSKLQEKIKKYKAEQVDSYDVANMDLDSDSE